jgi:integrase
VHAATAFFRDLLAAGRAEPTVRSYGMDLLRWFRFETVLRAFYDFTWMRAAGRWSTRSRLTDRGGAGGRAHHNPMEPFRNERSGLYRPRVPDRIPRSVPDSEFNEIFARLPSHRDRALVAFYVSTGARASELLSATLAGTDPGRQLITVVRKGTCELQELPASTDAFVWLRLYQGQMAGLIPCLPDGRGSGAAAHRRAARARACSAHDDPDTARE